MTTHNVEITLEKTYRKTVSLTISDDDYQMLLNGDCAPIHESGEFTNIEEYEADEDWTMYDLDTEQQVVDWR